MRAYKVELDPNNKQRTLFRQYAGTARWAYNYGLRRKIESYELNGKSITLFDLGHEITLLRRSTESWLCDVSSWVPRGAIRNLENAYKNFYRRCKSSSRMKGFPKFKSKKNGIGSFNLCDVKTITHSAIILPRIGRVRLKEHGYVPCEEVVKSVTISERAGHWFAAVLTDEDPPLREHGNNVTGIDVGISKLAVLSDGTEFENPRALEKAQTKLRILYKSASRKQKGSNNRKKAASRLARKHYQVACIRKDAIHKATTAIIKRSSLIAIETLNVHGMMKNHHTARAVADTAMSEFLRQIEYKANWSGINVVKADMFFPSSKMCSRCGNVKPRLSLSTKLFRCFCGLELDRDLNAAINLKNLAVSSTATACCPGGSGQTSSLVKPLVGQEPNSSESVGIGA